MFIPFRKIKTTDLKLDQVQTNIAITAESLKNNPLLYGNLIENIDLSTTAINIPHKLGRLYKGWIITAQNAAETIYSDSTYLPTQYLNLKATGSVTVSLWVF